MLDTNICSFIMREKPESVLSALQEKVLQRNKIVISSITYAEFRFGAIGKKSSSKICRKRTMRLTTHQIECIRQLVTELLGADVKVRVFGSRLDDNAKGGDLDRAEKLGFLDSADEWMSIRNLRNQMIHDYVPTLEKVANNILGEIDRRRKTSTYTESAF